MIALTGDLSGVIAFFLMLINIPTAILFLIGFAIRKKHANASKVLYILAIVYLIIANGACVTLIT